MQSFKNMSLGKKISLTGLALCLSACATTPTSPSVMALPPQGKPFEQFQAEQSECENYAGSQVEATTDQANTMGIVEGVGGTVLGAGLGAAVGGGRGAAIGAAGGAVAGTAVGGSSSERSNGSIQHKYDNYYTQCMVSHGNTVNRPAPPPPRTVIYQTPPTTVIYQAPPPPPPPVVYYPAPGYAPPPPGYPAPY